MRDIPNNFYNLDIYGKSSKRPYNRGKSFGYQVLGFGAFTSGGLKPLQRGIFPFGYSYVTASDADVYYATSNLVNDQGVMQSDTSAVSGVGPKAQGAGATYGGDKAIHAFGYLESSSAETSLKNLISNIRSLEFPIWDTSSVAYSEVYKKINIKKLSLLSSSQPIMV